MYKTYVGKLFTAKDKLEIYTTIKIKNILAVDEVQSLLTLKLKLTLKWIDVRLKYRNLDKNSDMNNITPYELEEIWTPDLMFANTKNSQVVNLRNKSSVAIEIIKGRYILELVSSNTYTFIFVEGSFFLDLNQEDNSFTDDSAMKNPSNEIFNGRWHQGKDW